MLKIDRTLNGSAVFYEMVIMEYILLALFTLAAVIFIINSHYRWTYFFAIAQFVLFF